MKRIVKTLVRYRCEICRTDYDTANRAKKCENGPIEKKKFKIGDEVTGREKHRCDHAGKDRDFFPHGKVVEISRCPEPMDDEYSWKWLGGKLYGWHVYRYVVRYPCICGKSREHEFYSPEIVLVNKK